MKRPQPDLATTLKDGHIGNLKTVRGILNRWGTEYVNGVEVFTPRQYYYPDNLKDQENFERLFKFLGVYRDLEEGEYEGVEKAWLYFNKNKATSLPGTTDDFVAENLNKLWWDPDDGEQPENLTLTGTIILDTSTVLKKNLTRVSEIVNVAMTKEQAIASISNNFDELWDMIVVDQVGIGVINKGSTIDPVTKASIPDKDDLTANDPWLACILRYALRYPGLDSVIKDFRISTIKSNQGTGSVASKLINSLVVGSYELEIEIPYTVFNTTQPIVRDIATDIDSTYKKTRLNGYITREAVKAMDFRDLLVNPNIVSRNYTLWEDVSAEINAVYNQLWLKVGKKYYLKAAPFRNPRDFGLKYKDLAVYLPSTLDSNYKKEDVPWYKKAIAVVLVIIAIILLIVYPVNAANGTVAKLLAVAKGIVMLSLVITLVTVILAIAGFDEWAQAFAYVNKIIEPLVILAQIYLVITGLMAAYEKAEAALQKAAMDAAKEAGTEFVDVTVSEVLAEMVLSQADSFIDNIVKGATDVYSGAFATNAAIAFNTKLVNLINTGYKLKLASIANRNKDLKAEYDKLTEEASRESDALKGFSKIYAKPATGDWSHYSSLYDLPYEKGGGSLSLGNVQRTTKQALRKADYKDPAFAGIFII